MIKPAWKFPWAALVLLGCSAPALSGASDSWSAGDSGRHPKAVAVTARNGGGLISVMPGLGRGTKVHRARLYLTRGPTRDPRDLLDDIQACPGTSASGKPLPLAGPWFDHFDVTEAVKAAVAGGRDLNVFVKDFPGWDREQTRLEVWHDGQAPAAPPAVKEVKAFHRAGQTFITWTEVKPLARSEKLTWGEYTQALSEARDPVRYRIYGHDRPITDQTILQAQLLAEVGPMSGWNVNGRNIEYLIGQAMVKSDATGELAERYNSLMYTWGPDSGRMDRYPLERFVIDEPSGPLPPGTGLYVHSPAAAGKRCYAVVSCVDGVENISDFSGAAAGPVEETVGAGEPVCQGDGLWGPFFDYPGRRKVYVQWCAPPLAPLPGMYFNWSVLVPPERTPALEQAGAVPPPPSRPRALRPVELYFHTSGFSYAKPQTKYLLDSIQIAPHDYPFSNWYGFNSSYGTLKGYRSGTVGNHTQKRVMAFLDWARSRLPVDPDRTLLAGGDGAAMLAVNYPETFSYVMVTRFESLACPPEKLARGEPSLAKAEAALGPVWGVKSPDIKDDQGRGDWGWAMLDGLVAAQPRRDLPLFCCRSESWGLYLAAFGKGFGRFYTSLLEARQPLVVNWSWGGGAPLFPDKYTGRWRGLDLSRKTALPAFANCSADANQDGNGQINGWITWRDVKESPEAFEVTIAGRGTADVTPRRCQSFKPKPGQTFNWQYVPLPQPRAASLPAAQSGHVVADAGGLVTVKGLALGNGAVLKITPAQ